MEVILKQDVDNLGYQNEIVKVKNGYARNYLIPQGLAILATETNRKVLAEVQRQKSFKEQKLRKDAETTQKLLEKLELKIGAKAGTSGKIFGSVNSIQIAEALKEKGYDIDRKKIDVDGDNIKETGTYTAKVHLFREIKAIVNFEVLAE
ncbi:MAG: 50S ribosomal protein L9 [Bacteroidales bacterium]|nr:50S ribosomal protein L9 [Bacteroidales bacterium]